MKKMYILGLIGLVLITGLIFARKYDLFENRGVNKSDSLIGEEVSKEEIGEVSKQDQDLSGSNLPKPPSLIREIPASKVSPEVLTIVKERILEITSLLKQDPNLFDEWIKLGVQRKIVGDYDGAKEVWEYASLIRPKNSVSFQNLGDLYHYYLKDYTKAEQNLKKFVENDNFSATSYVYLFDLYRYSYQKETNKAYETLKVGIEKNPKSIDLRLLLADYLLTKNNKAEAESYFKQALDLAKSESDVSKIKLIEERLKAI